MLIQAAEEIAVAEVERAVELRNLCHEAPVNLRFEVADRPPATRFGRVDRR